MTTQTSIGGYRLDRDEPLPHLDGRYLELTHERTGARHIHVATSDTSKSFAVLLPTIPADSTGVAHILEHVVLAGSKRYPVRDPFFSMLPRSLNDFMNASTGSDLTVYPVSTRNLKDFYNLLDIYLDAVFAPLMSEDAFNQEGHRLEFADPEDPASGLTFTGVVFNEMKGSMASPSRVMWNAIAKALFPDLTYAYNSGGDPAAIPDLTWQGLRDFHARHYHPGTARFFTYGDMPLDEVLSRIESAVLHGVEPQNGDLDVGDQPRFTAPRELRTTYPLGPDEDPSKKGQALVGWIATRVDDPFDLLAHRVLEQVLLGNAASPLRKALMDSKLGDTLADGSGLIDSFREVPFCAGLKGIDPADAGHVEAVVLETLEELARNGIERSTVDAAVHQIELDAREVSHAGAPYGLQVFFHISGALLHGADPYRALQLDEDLARLPSDTAFFEELIRTRMLDNPHRATVVLEPDQGQETREKEAERSRLAAIESSLTDADKQTIVVRSRELRIAQEARQDLSMLPTLELSDIPMAVEDASGVIEELGGAVVGRFAQPTNGLTYIDVRADFALLPDDLKDLLPLFAYAVPRMGAGPDDYLAMAARIDAHTGGIEAQAAMRCGAEASHATRERLVVRGKALARNHEPFAAILGDLLGELRFEADRLAEIVAEYRARFEASLAQAGHSYAARLAAARLTPEARLEERLYGLSQLALLRRVDASEDLGEVIAGLEAIRDQIFVGPGLQICVTSEERYLGDLRELTGEMVEALPVGPGGSASLRPPAAKAPEVRHEARTIAAPVAYNARIFRTVRYTHPDAPALVVLGHYMRATYLHREIREKGGAYGSASSAAREDGLFTFSSYRDPNIVRTFEAFAGAIRHVLDDPIEPDDLKEAILGACSAVDPLLSPDNKGRTRFFDDLAGYTIETKLAFKRGLLEVTADDLRRVASTYLTADDAPMAVLGGPDKIAEANDAMGGVFEVSPA